MKKGIIFDMDGTLWDSAAQVAQSWNIAAAEIGYEYSITAEDIMAVMGKPMDELAAIIFSKESQETCMKLLDICGNYENEYLRQNGAVLYPDLRETMEALKEMGYHLYIVSNCQSGYIEAFLDYYDFWKYFEDIECYGNNELPKGDNIAGIIRRNEVTSAVYVGDIQGDYDATMSAKEQLEPDGVKVDFILADYGFGDVDAEVVEIASLKELPQAVTKIFD
jgi:phosphoglycolate phosphatase